MRGLLGAIATTICLSLSNQAMAATQYEAENATLSGGANKNTNHAGYSGSGFVDGFFNSTTALATFTVSAPSAGSATVTLRFSAGNGTSTNTGLYVNGSKLRNITCNTTSNWDTWANKVETVTLNAGNNTIGFKAETSSGSSINIDYISVQTTAATYTVTYNGNSNTGGTAPVDANGYVQGATVTVAAAGTLVRTGYAFAGWNTAANGSGTNYSAGSTFAMGTANMTLYARWVANATYKVTYNGNSNTGGTAPVDANSYLQGATVTIAAAGTLVRTGYAFAGWNTAANGSGTNYSAGSTFAMGTVNLTLYARWVTSSFILTITNDGHGSTSPSGSVTVNAGANTSISATAASGYQFSNWTVSSGNATIASPTSAATTVVTPGGDATIRANFTATTPVGASAVDYAEITAPVMVTADNTVVLQLTITAPSAGYITVTATGLYGTNNAYSDEQRGLESFITLNSTTGGTRSGFGEKAVQQGSAHYVNETIGFQVAAGNNIVRLIVSPRTTLTKTTYQFVKARMTVVFAAQRM